MSRRPERSQDRPARQELRSNLLRKPGRVRRYTDRRWPRPTFPLLRRLRRLRPRRLPRHPRRRRR